MSLNGLSGRGLSAMLARNGTRKVGVGVSILSLVFIAACSAPGGAGSSSGSANQPSASNASSSASDTVEVQAGPITVLVPADWEDISQDSLGDPWTVGKKDPNSDTQIRLSPKSPGAPRADAVNSILMSSNAIGTDGFEPGSLEKADVPGSDNAQIAYFGVNIDGSYYNGYFASAGNRESGNVATLEMMSSEDNGLSQDEAMKIADSIRYDASKEVS